MPGTVVLTRPPGQADALAARLAALGFDVMQLPAFDIVLPDDVEPIVQAWAGIDAFDLIHFASANAITGFFAQRPAGVRLRAGTMMAVMGPGSRRALAPWIIDDTVRVVTPGEENGDNPPEALDSETLMTTLRALLPHGLRGLRALLVKGEGGRDWLAQALVADGVEIDAVPVYRRECPALTPAQRARLETLRQQEAHLLFVVTSSEGVQNLDAMLSGAPLLARFVRQSPLIVTHARVAARARTLGFSHVLECAPNDDAVVRTLESVDPPTCHAND